MDPVLPDYRGACVSRVVPELLGDGSASWLPAPVRDADSVVLVVLDGLGWNELEARGRALPNLAALEGSVITTVVPSTTASALTSITTGLPPAQHGLTGFRMLVDGSVLNVLRWQVSSSTSPPEPEAVQRHAAFGGRPVPAITKREFRGSGFTKAHLGGVRFQGWSTTAVLVSHCRRLVDAGEPFVFAYYPGIDEVAHEFGLEDECYERELNSADRLVGDLVAALPPTTAVVVTSDHGQVAMHEQSWIELDGVSDMIVAQAGDARFRSLYAREGAREDLAAALRGQLRDRAWVVTRRELVESGWLGPELARATGGRIGDVVLAACDPVGFVDPALPFERRLRSAHGAPTAAEMLVPLVATRGTATTS